MDETPIEFGIAHYEQVHEMRRDYLKQVFQAPTIVVAVGGVVLAVFEDHLSDVDMDLPMRLSVMADVLLVLSGFVLVIAYWAYRSRLLLRRLEKTLVEIEARYACSGFVSYPFELNRELGVWKRLPSTLFIVVFLHLLGMAAVTCSAIGYYLRLTT